MESNNLRQFLPPNTEETVNHWLKELNVKLVITRARSSKYGDYRKSGPNGCKITINGNLNIYRFLITLMHEIAHAGAFSRHGDRISPHGSEWKEEFQIRMTPFYLNDVFPPQISKALYKYMLNPKASSSMDDHLQKELSVYDEPSEHDGLEYLEKIPLGTKFKLLNGKQMIKGEKLRRKYLCVDVFSKRKYAVVGMVRVKIVN